MAVTDTDLVNTYKSQVFPVFLTKITRVTQTVRYDSFISKHMEHVCNSHTLLWGQGEAVFLGLALVKKVFKATSLVLHAFHAIKQQGTSFLQKSAFKTLFSQEMPAIVYQM